jgi:hypothetical protein
MKKISKKLKYAKIFFSAYTPFAEVKYPMQLIKKTLHPYSAVYLPEVKFIHGHREKPAPATCCGLRP